MVYPVENDLRLSGLVSSLAQFCVSDTVTVVVPQSELARFRRKALKTFPLELFAYLIGDVYKPGGKIKRIEVSRLDYPKCNATTMSVGPLASEVERVWEESEDGEMVVGTIHSHPWAIDEPAHFDPNPSTSDIVNAAELGELVYMIYNICEMESGRKATKLGVFLGTPNIQVEMV